MKVVFISGKMTERVLKCIEDIEIERLYNIEVLIINIAKLPTCQRVGKSYTKSYGKSIERGT